MINAMPFKRLADIRTSNVDKKTIAGEIPVLLCNYTDVYKSDEIASGMDLMSASATAEQVRRFTLHCGDVIFTKDSETPDDIAIPAYVSEDLPGVLCGYHLAIATPRFGIADGRFLYWALQALPVAKQFHVAATGVTRFGLRQSSIGRVEIPCPGVQEQVRIAALLDMEISAMGRLAHELEEQRLLLDERDKVAVKRLVTGVDVSGPRASVGPWWLGSTPSSWTPQKISRNFLTGSGTTPKSGDARFYGGPHHWLNTGECRDGVVTETAKTVTDEALSEYSSLKFYPVGSLVVAMYGATIGKLAVLGSEMTVNQACVVLHHSRELDTQFVYWWLWAHRAELLALGEGGGQPNISQEVIRQLIVPAPPLEVQRKIVGEIEKMRQWSQRMRDESDRQAALLAERRQSVITAAVTGQMEVA